MRTVKSKSWAYFLIYLSSLTTGVAWSLLPSLSSFFLLGKGITLSEAQYGFLTFYLNAAAIIASISVGVFRKKIRIEKLWALGVVCLAVAKLGLPIASLIPTNNKFIIYIMISSGAALSGIGIALLVSSLNVILISLVPKHSPTALTAMYGSISIGSAFTPLVVIYLARIINWELIPLTVSVWLFCIFLAICFTSIYLLDETKDFSSDFRKIFIRSRIFYGFIALIFLYSFVETTYGYWSPVFVHNLGIKIQEDSLSLSLFWGAFAVGQLLTSFIVFKLSPKKMYLILMSTMLTATGLILILDKFYYFDVISFILAGLGCSGFYPLTVHFFEKVFPNAIHTASGLIVGFYFSGVAIFSLVASFTLNIFPDFIHRIYWVALFAILGLFLLSIPVVLKKEN